MGRFGSYSKNEDDTFVRTNRDVDTVGGKKKENEEGQEQCSKSASTVT